MTPSCGNEQWTKPGIVSTISRNMKQTALKTEGTDQERLEAAYRAFRGALGVKTTGKRK